MGISGFAEMQRLQDHVMRQFIEDFRGLLQVRCENPGADMSLAAEYVAAVAERLGYTVRIDHVPDSLAHQHHVRKAVNVLARIGPDADQAVILNAHFDTTPPGEGWSVDPYSGHLKDEVLYGRGAAVSKSDVMGYLYAVYMAYQMVRPSFPVFVMLTGDEETGGYLGPQRLLALGSWPAHTVAICPGSADVVVDRHGGALLWTIVLRGRSRHAAVSERGGDSVKAGAELITEFYQYRDADAVRRGGWLTCGIARGGVAANMVAGSFEIHIDRRVNPREQLSAVRQELQAVLDGWAKRHRDIQWHVEEVVAAEPMNGENNHTWAKWFADHAAGVLKQPIPLGASPLFTDARHFDQAQIPTICYGAGQADLFEMGAHGPDEHIAMADSSRAMLVLSTVVATLWRKGPTSLVDLALTAKGDEHD
ncbi:MAG: hypothetical protein C7B44_10185 [Sulfobacillus thermosulfidooxidans]|nr:MAG: hypothetical protein C7B44_10185 [Sulfobacillus thermosulfidooxidans]